MRTLLLCLSELQLTSLKAAYPQGTVTSLTGEGSASGGEGGGGCCFLFIIIFLVWSRLCLIQNQVELDCLRFLKMKFTVSRPFIKGFFSWKGSQECSSFCEHVRRRKPEKVLWWLKRCPRGPGHMTPASALAWLWSSTNTNALKLVLLNTNSWGLTTSTRVQKSFIGLSGKNLKKKKKPKQIG